MFVPDWRLKLGDCDSIRGVSPGKMKKVKSLDLRQQYIRVLEIALILSISLMIIAFRFFPHIELDNRIVVTDQEIIEFEDIDQTRQEDRPPPPPRPPIMIETPFTEIIDHIDFFTSEINFYEDVPPPPPPKVVEEDEFGDYFVAVEHMPEIKGGLAALTRHLQYPELARRAGVEGIVYILAFVDSDGIVRRTEIVRGIGAGCDEAAAEALTKVEFVPGMQRGQPVNVRVMVPVRFSLQRTPGR
jgi:periplasmic protein TonB